MAGRPKGATVRKDTIRSTFDFSKQATEDLRWLEADYDAGSIIEAIRRCIWKMRKLRTAVKEKNARVVLEYPDGNREIFDLD